MPYVAKPKCSKADHNSSIWRYQTKNQSSEVVNFSLYELSYYWECLNEVVFQTKKSSPTTNQVTLGFFTDSEYDSGEKFTTKFRAQLSRANHLSSRADVLKICYCSFVM